MEVTSHSDITESGANKSTNQTDCISSQPAVNGMLPHQNTGEAPPLLCNRPGEGHMSDDSLTDSPSTNDVSQLLPTQRKQNGVDSSSASPPPICTPPSASITSAPPLRPPAYKKNSCSLPQHHHHQSTNQKRLSSTRSHASIKTDAAHIKEVAGDDCCAHCLLACLFCELLSMCSAMGECLVCGVGGTSCCDAAVGCCCCVEVAGEAACTEEACQAMLDCGIVDDCCGSSDCLEICLECCSICFPA
uniref:MyoD family inhibitor domain containing n=1 Tax=Monopterus albus TaxID=43700 RepID=A0A3Q3JI43_MONAL|nr:myoD family inhibitor domain-containing protein-like [Monopterus albus]XP_020444493.1 myoD family inhibitor domain-containing protein-like [Monopterus albus]